MGYHPYRWFSAVCSFVKLDMSMRIEGQGDLAKVAIAASVSVDAAKPCAGDGCTSTVGTMYARGTRTEKR